MKRKIAILCVAVFCMQSLLTGCSKEETALAEKALKPVILKQMKEASFLDQASFSGNIKPATTIKLGYKILGGTIQNVYVEEGQSVKKGQSIMKLASYDYEQRLDMARAKWESSKMKMDSQVPSAMDQAKAYLDLIEKNYERVKNLYSQGAVAMAKMDEMTTKYIEAKNKYQEALDAKEYTRVELQQAEAAKNIAESDLKDTLLTSPIDGMVLKKLSEVGETAAIGRPVVVLGKMDKVEVEIGVPDSMINRMKVGQKAKVYVYGVEKEYDGVISEVSALADEKTRTFPVKITIDNAKKTLKPGMVGKVNIPLSQQKGILVPLDAILKMPKGPVVFVYNKENKIVEERQVTTGEIKGDEVVITKGIKSGDQIVVEGQFKLKNQDKINVEAIK